MKTNIVITRKLGSFDVHQQTKDSFFNASSLLQQWNKSNPSNKRQIDRFLNSPKTKEFIEVLNNEESQKAKMLYADYKSIIVIKGRNTKSGKTSDKILLHPYLFIDFAMWLNPRFKYSVIKFVYDQLIEHRHKAGDNYKLLAASASIFPDVNYPHIAKGLNWIIFNKHEKGIRDKATEAQMNELHLLEEKLCFAIDMGYIKSFDGLMNEMRKIHFIKNKNF